MASNVTAFVVLGPSGRRHTVKVSPNTSVLQLFEEACEKDGVNPNDYDLKHYNKSLDLSLSVRFANLPNNALLELHPTKGNRRESTVTVGLQLESGDRLTGHFTPSTTVWDVVSKCLTSRGDCNKNEDYSTGLPSCIYMRQIISGDAMKQTTLRNLGLTGGKAVFRLIYRQPSELQQQAHVSAPLKKSVIEPVFYENNETSINMEDPGCSVDKQTHSDTSLNRGAIENVEHIFPKMSENILCCKADKLESFHTGKTDLSSIPHNNTNIVKEEVIQPVISDSKKQATSEDLMEVDSSSMNFENLPIKEKGSVKILGERNAILFNLEDIPVIPRTELPDDFYELTIEDVRYLMEEYKRIRMELENKPLELRTQKENKSLQQLALYTQCVIRIYFPDRLVLQGIFSVGETINTVAEFIRGYLEDKELDFYLYTAPPKVKLPKEKSLFECELLPAAIVYFGCDKNLGNYLLPHIKEKISDPGAAYKAAAKSRNKGFSAGFTFRESSAGHEDLDNVSDMSIPSTSTAPHTNCELSKTKVPKWFQSNQK